MSRIIYWSFDWPRFHGHFFVNDTTNTLLSYVAFLDNKSDFPTMPLRIDTQFFEHFGHSPTMVASAPGRIEFLGNHTDYNGGLVIAGAIDRRLYVGVSKRLDNEIHLTSDRAPEIVKFVSGAVLLSGSRSWTRYPLAVLEVLKEKVELDAGFNLAVTSDIPVGAGLSSSAALELATAIALNDLRCLSLTMEELVVVAHRAETQYVGVPCGILDQTVIAHAKNSGLMLIDASDGSRSIFPISSDTLVWLFQTHQSHRLDVSPYASRRRDCEEALLLLRKVIPKVSRLTQLHAADLAVCIDLLPEMLYHRAAHIIGEQARVIKATLVTDMPGIGQLLFDSHASSRDYFENSTDALDFVVDALKTKPGVLGARLTGAGFGGAAMAWTTSAFSESEALTIVQDYATRFDAECKVWQVAWSDGARIEHRRDDGK